MFRPDPTLCYLDLTGQQVVSVVESLNQPQISVPAKAPQPAQAYLCGVRDQAGALSVYAVLSLCQTGENVVYAHEPRRLGEEAYASAESEGLSFLEAMGFMLDDVGFQDMSATQQQRTLSRVRAFSPHWSAPPATPRPEARPTALARLLASF